MLTFLAAAFVLCMLTYNVNSCQRVIVITYHETFRLHCE